MSIDSEGMGGAREEARAVALAQVSQNVVPSSTSVTPAHSSVLRSGPTDSERRKNLNNP
jgi:hypothetical protein